MLSVAVANLNLDPELGWHAVWYCMHVARTDAFSWGGDTVGSLGIKTVTLSTFFQVQKVANRSAPLGLEIDSSITFSIVPEWHFSAIYPVVPIISTFSRDHYGGT